MTLLPLWTAFDTSAQSLVALASSFGAGKPALISASSFTLQDECFLEGLLSRTWQEWSHFCRECLIESSLGTVDGSGNVVAGLPQAVSEQHVSSAAIQAKHRRSPLWGGTNPTLRLEPTWGDVDALVTILQALKPANGAQLLAAFSSGHGPAKAIQLIRNAAAHNHAQNLVDVAALGSSYVAYPVTHPTQALFWVEPKAGDFLLIHALQELSITARLAIG